MKSKAKRVARVVPAVSRRLRMLFFLDYDNGQGGRFSNSPGLLPLIGHVRKSGVAVDFIDSEQDLFKALQNRNVDVVGISSMERMLPRSIACARRVRELRSDVVLILGGNSIESFALDLATSLFDIVVTGEAEHTLPALLRAIALDRGLYHAPQQQPADLTLIGTAETCGPAESDGALSSSCVARLKAATFRRTTGSSPPLNVDLGLSGVYVRDSVGGQVWLLQQPKPPVFTQIKQSRGQFATSSCATHEALSLTTRPLNHELDRMCIFPWELVTSRLWSTLEFYTQRGCKWGRCEFCSINDQDIRALSHRKILAVLEAASRRGVTTVSFSDDLFVQNPEWNRELLEKILSRGLDLKFRAQTMATRSVWPLLALMQQVGFVELAFGVETLNPDRARFMAKSYNGHKYVENAKETVARVAEAGICPVLYMIMVDPRSTLLEIAEELNDIVNFLSDVYRRTGVVPKLSYTLMMLPVAGPVMTTRYPYTTTDVQIGNRILKLPAEFKVDPPIASYLKLIANHTENMPFRRENLSALNSYLSALVSVAETYDQQNLARIGELAESGLRVLAGLTRELDRDVESTAFELLALQNGTLPSSNHRSGRLRFEYTRFGGYVSGVQHYSDLLAQGMFS